MVILYPLNFPPINFASTTTPHYPHADNFAPEILFIIERSLILAVAVIRPHFQPLSPVRLANLN